VTDHVTLRLHTGGLYLTNYMTSEGNWLHQILFRGFIAKGGRHMHAPRLKCLKKNETTFFSPLLTILCKSKSNQFKLQVVMQQNRKNAKGGEYFCKAL
jgi:hypothetical protein